MNVTSYYYLVLILLTVPFLVNGHVMANESATEPSKATISGRIVKIDLKDKYFELMRKRAGSVVRVYVDDPSRLRGLRRGLHLKVVAEKSDLVNGAYMAREIMTRGSTCRCDPTGVRARIKRAMGRGGWSCGGRWSRPATGRK